jgi:alkylation response protein AidB-like acyl-CoA dehydrogenase
VTADFRASVRSALAGAGLAPRPAGGRTTFLGAGTDDLSAGRAFLAALAEGGWAVPTWPVAAGGLGLDAEHAAVVNQELAAFDVPDLYPFMVGLALVGPTLLTHGSAEQQRRWLPAIRDGSQIWCQLFSEPDAGSDLAGLTTRAVRDDDGGDEAGGWRVTGQKVWSSRAHYSRWGLLLARTDPSVPKHRGITAFAIDMTVPGVVVRPLRQMNGDAHFNQVFLDDAPVADADRIGPVGGGWAVAITTLMHERGALGPGAGGPSRRQLLALAAAADPVARQRLAGVVSRLEVGRWTQSRVREGSGAKLRGSATVKAMADLAVDLLGPAGMLDPHGEWQTLFLTAPSLSIRGGTDEIQRNIVGERVLGLPPEPRPDKEVPFDQVPRP